MSISMINDRAAEILKEQQSILAKKNNDYTSDLINDEMYFTYDAIPGMPMMNAKLCRYIAVMENGSANYESAEDSLRDLINYAARTIAYNEIYRD